MILGTMLIAAVIIISGSVVATWVFAQRVVDYENVINPDNILYDDDDYYASLSGPFDPSWIFIDLNSSNAMPNNQIFTVFAETSINEAYNVSVGEILNPAFAIYVGTGWDASDQTFTTPLFGSGAWRYVLIEGRTVIMSA